MAVAGGFASYNDGELASSILLEDGDGAPPIGVGGGDSGNDTRATPPEESRSAPMFLGLGDPRSPYPGNPQPPYTSAEPAAGEVPSALSEPGLLNPVVGGPVGGKGGRGILASPEHARAPNRTPTRTPSPDYQWNHPKKVTIGDPGPDLGPFQALSSAKSSSSTSAASRLGAGGCAAAEQPDSNNQLFSMSFPPFLHPYWAGALHPAQMQAYYGMMMSNPLVGQQAAAQQAEGKGVVAAMDPNILQAMVAMQAGQGTAGNLAVTAAPGGCGACGACGCGGPAAGIGKGISGNSAASAARGAGCAASETTEEEKKGTPRNGGPDMGAGAAGSSMAGMAVPQQGRGGKDAHWGARKGGPGLAHAEGGKRTKSRGKGLLESSGGFARPTPVDVPAAPGGGVVGGGCAGSGAGCGGAPFAGAPSGASNAAPPRERGGLGPPGQGQAAGKSERRRRGGATVADEHGASGTALGPAGGGGGKSRPSDLRGPPSSSPFIEQLKASKSTDLSDLAWNISEIAKDQYGSRLIQQKLELANEEEKQAAFVSVLQNMSSLTTDVFGNYVIQKFFEYGSNEQRRILAEQLVGQVLRLSLQMYGCRVVQKALDSVPIEQQVLLVGELKGNVIKCIEDQHGNHVIQKCIERLPTDKINFVVESFEGHACRMAKHCYGCRVLQRLIEYCASSQISTLLDEVLRQCSELATDQYGNYVVQHVMEHSSRPGDRYSIMTIVRKNILSLSCHKYASNVVEKALTCGTPEERANLIQAVVGESGESQIPLTTMMRDKFGNYIVQRTIHLAQGVQRQALFAKLQEQMTALKKSNTYGKHIITALERAQAQAEGESPSA